MDESVIIGLMVLAFLAGYTIARIDVGGDLEWQWKAGYLAGARATRAAIQADWPAGGGMALIELDELAGFMREAAALATLPAEPEGETWFQADVRRASERQEQINAASPSRRAAALSALAEMDADEIVGAHPATPQPAVRVADWIEAVVQKAEVEWSYHEDDAYPPRDFWHARCVLGDATWTAYGKQEEFKLPQEVQLAAEHELRGDLRRILSTLEPLSPAPAAEDAFRRGAEADLDRDIGILIAQIDWLVECTGEGLEVEDAALLAQIRADHEARALPLTSGRAPPRPVESELVRCHDCGKLVAENEAQWTDDGSPFCQRHPLDSGPLSMDKEP